MMAVYIDKYQMYFWVIITERHQHIYYLCSNPQSLPNFLFSFPVPTPNRDDETIHAPQYILFIMVSICMSRIGYPPHRSPLVFFS
jgi:hypothetical protein